MLKSAYALLLALVVANVASASVTVSAPANGSHVDTTVQFVASATTSCSKGVSAIGVYTAPGVLAYSSAGSSLNTELTLSPGTYSTTVQDWDNCGGSTETPVTIYVGSSSSSSGVTVTAPLNNANVATQVQYVATATTTCSKGVSAMGIYTAPGVLAYTHSGSSLNTILTLNSGKTYKTTVQEWDNCGGSSSTPITVNVGGSSGSSQVTVTAPLNNSSVSSTVQYVATATSTCAAGVSAMGIYTAPGKLAYTTGGASLNTQLSLSNGTYSTTVTEWDNCGKSASTPVTITVGGSSTSGTFTNLHQQSGWTGYALLPALYNICDSCDPSGPDTTWSMTQKVSSPSRSGSSTKTAIGGQTVYSDALWNNHLIGDFSSQNMPDYNHSIIPNLHNFTYDVYFYMDDVGPSQALEFDINQFVDGNSYIWGHECRIAGGNEWDIWDNPGQKWHKTGVACNPVANSWNHLVLQVQRTSDNHLLFQSITLNGVTATLNYYETPTATTWYGVTINYQQDGNYAQTPYSVWLDNLNFSYW